MSGQLKATASQEFAEKKTGGREQREERTRSKEEEQKPTGCEEEYERRAISGVSAKSFQAVRLLWSRGSM